MTAKRRETCNGSDLVFLNNWALIVLAYIYVNSFMYMWRLNSYAYMTFNTGLRDKCDKIFCERFWYLIGTLKISFTWITRIFIVSVTKVFYCRRVYQSLSTIEMIWLIGLLCICCNVYRVRMNVSVVCWFCMNGIVCMMFVLLTWPFIFYRVGMKWKLHGFLWLSRGFICAVEIVNIDYNP